MLELMPARDYDATAVHAGVARVRYEARRVAVRVAGAAAGPTARCMSDWVIHVT